MIRWFVKRCVYKLSIKLEVYYSTSVGYNISNLKFPLDFKNEKDDPYEFS